MTNPGICFVGMFYEVEDHVLAFITGGIEGSCLHWLDMDNPHTMYIAWGGVTENNWLWTRNEDGVVSKIPVVYSLTKTDIPPNEPEENFLSIFKLYEISRDYGIDWDMLVHMEYNREEDSGIRYRVHNDSYDFYPVYLISETPDKLEFKTQVGNRYVECIDIKYTIEKIDGKWTRTVVLLRGTESDQSPQSDALIIDKTIVDSNPTDYYSTTIPPKEKSGEFSVFHANPKVFSCEISDNGLTDNEKIQAASKLLAEEYIKDCMSDKYLFRILEYRNMRNSIWRFDSIWKSMK